MTSQDEFFDFIDSLSQYDNMYPPIPKFILEASFHVLEIHTFGGNIPNRTKSKPSLVVSTAKWTTPQGHRREGHGLMGFAVEEHCEKFMQDNIACAPGILANEILTVRQIFNRKDDPELGVFIMDPEQSWQIIDPDAAIHFSAASQFVNTSVLPLIDIALTRGSGPLPEAMSRSLASISTGTGASTFHASHN